MEYRNAQIKEQEKKEKQPRSELHAFAVAADRKATEETKAATKDQSFYSRNQNKRETRKADSKVWGAIGAMTNISSESASADETSLAIADNVVHFPISEDFNESVPTSEKDRQSLYSRKSQEKRKRDVTDE